MLQASLLESNETAPRDSICTSFRFHRVNHGETNNGLLILQTDSRVSVVKGAKKKVETATFNPSLPLFIELWGLQENAIIRGSQRSLRET